MQFFLNLKQMNFSFIVLFYDSNLSTDHSNKYQQNARMYATVGSADHIYYTHLVNNK